LTKIHFTILHLVEGLLPADVDGVNRAIRHSESRAIALKSVPFNSLSLSNLVYPFFPRQLGTSFRSLTMRSFLPGYFVVSIIPILTTYPNNLNCANSAVSL